LTPAAQISIPLLLVALIGGIAPLCAQVPEFPDSLNRQTVTARTERFASTHTTSLYADYQLQQGIVTGRMRSYLVSSTTLLNDPVTKDQIDTYIDMSYPLPSRMSLFMLAEGTLTNDLKRDLIIPGLNNTAATFLGIGGRVSDSAGNRIGLGIGGTYNRQLNAEDAGTALYGEVVGQTDIGGYRVQLDGQGHWYNIAPRHNSNGYLDFQVTRRFEEGAYGDLHGRYDLINTDLYIKRNEEDIRRYGGLTYDGLQARNERRMMLNSTLGYPAGDALLFDVNLTMNNSLIAQQEESEGLPPLPRTPDPFRYAREDLSIGTSFGLHWTPHRTRLGLQLNYFTNEERNTVDPTAAVSEAELKRKRETGRQSDFVSQQLMLGGSLEYRLARYDTLSADASVSIYRYDTPDTANKFDKDEQSIRAQIRYARSFNPRLAFAIYGQIFLTHLVYLFGENSNDNNWNRVFRLAPSVRYNLGDDFQNVLEAEVLANYTQYDFEGRTQTIRGRSFRELRIRDSFALALSGTLRLAAQGDLRVSERGSFDWVQFAESPLERTRIEGVEAELVTSSIGGMNFGIGARLSRAKTYTASTRGTLEPSSDRTSVGPTARIEIHLSEHSEILFSGWWEHRFEESELVARVPTMFLTVGMKL
jgi:hypothetical protein